MTPRLPHRWEPDPREPDICVDCLLPRVDARDPDEECAVRLRAELDRVATQNANLLRLACIDPHPPDPATPAGSAR